LSFGRIATIYVLAICVLLSVTSVSAPLLLSAPEGRNMNPAGYEFFELIEGPLLDSSDDVVEMGGADEFDHEYYYTGGNYGHLNLTWDHDSGTEIHTRSPFNPEMPDTMEFVYFKQTVEWEYNIMPLDVNITFDYGIIRTGDFYASELMFCVYIWLIDSSGDWREVYRSDPPYVNGHMGTHSISLDSLDIHKAWAGMIENDAGHQEDPSDELTFAIGLAPTDSFVNYYGGTPWLTYDGSVTLMVTHFDAWVLLRETLPEEMIQPLENKTWGNTDRNELVIGMDVAPDGAIYTVGYSMPANDPYTGGESNLLLIKWDSQANVSWARTTGNDSGIAVGYAVAAHDNYVYTVGGIFENIANTTMKADTFLVKWQSNGNKLLERRYDFGNVDAAISVDTRPDGSLYVVYLVQEVSPVYTNEMYLSKFDSNLTQIWSVSINEFPYTFTQLVGTTNDGHIYTASLDSLTKWDSDGNRVWFKNGTFVCMSVVPNGYVYAVQMPVMGIYVPYEQQDPRLIVWQTNSEPITNVSLTSSFGDIFKERTVPGALTTAADGSAYFSFYTYSSGGTTHYLAEYDIYGNQIWNRTMSNDTYPAFYGFYPNLMDCDSNGRIYMAGTSIEASDSYDYNLNIRLLVYLDPSYSVWGLFNIPLGEVASIALYGAAIIMIVFVVVDFTRRRRAM